MMWTKDTVNSIVQLSTCLPTCLIHIPNSVKTISLSEIMSFIPRWFEWHHTEQVMWSSQLAMRFLHTNNHEFHVLPNPIYQAKAAFSVDFSTCTWKIIVKNCIRLQGLSIWLACDGNFSSAAIALNRPICIDRFFRVFLFFFFLRGGKCGGGGGVLLALKSGLF